MQEKMISRIRNTQFVERLRSGEAVIDSRMYQGKYERTRLNLVGAVVIAGVNVMLGLLFLALAVGLGLTAVTKREALSIAVAVVGSPIFGIAGLAAWKLAFGIMRSALIKK